jgi:hypothetical protein
MEKNSVANYISIVTARHELLGFVNGEILETIDSEVGEHVEGIGTLDK